MDPSPELEEAIRAACAEFKIKQDDAFLIRSLLNREEWSWPACCGSRCKPCMGDVADAARMVKSHLAKTDTGATK